MYFTRFAAPALKSLGLVAVKDVVSQPFNFDAQDLAQLSMGEQLIASGVQAAIEGEQGTRLVYSAGGGANTAAEAIGWLRNQGYSDAQIRDQFAIVQHSTWNFRNATEVAAQKRKALNRFDFDNLPKRILLHSNLPCFSSSSISL